MRCRAVPKKGRIFSLVFRVTFEGKIDNQVGSFIRTPCRTLPGTCHSRSEAKCASQKTLPGIHRLLYDAFESPTRPKSGERTTNGYTFSRKQRNPTVQMPL
jgi:hypothetical protein